MTGNQVTPSQCCNSLPIKKGDFYASVERPGGTSSEDRTNQIDLKQSVST